LSYCDFQMGRIVDALADTGELDNTLVIYIQGDNGASAEGGPNGLLNEMAFFNAIPEDFKEVMRTQRWRQAFRGRRPYSPGCVPSSHR
jgi:arylsulfatase A-like enzyme